MAMRELTALDEEQRILDAGRRGDSDALDLLYRQFAAPLQAFCQSRLGDREAAEDACHDALLRAHRALPRFRSGNKLWPWLATIAANVCIDVQRREGRLVSLDEREDELADAPECEVERRAQEALVADAVRSLSPRYRSYIYWREFEDWSYEDIAKFEGASVASVRSRLMRARKVLKDELVARAAADRQWALPAAMPLLSNRFRSHISASFARLRARLYDRVAGRFPVTAQLFGLPVDISQVLGAAVISGLLFTGAVPATAFVSSPVAATSAGQPDAPAGADAAVAEGGAADAPTVRNSVEIATPSALPAAAVAGAGLAEEGEARTLEGIIAAKAGVYRVGVHTWTEFDCDYSEVRSAACDTAEQLPDLAPEE